jgi:hypothetical protein
VGWCVTLAPVDAMGGGGLNILPKKSWNVWNHDNIEKVRRDEAQHAAEQEALQQRQRGVDNEWRVEELRRRKRRADDGGGEAPAGAAAADADAERHVNFFEVEERQHAERGANEHHEREKKLQEEREARRSFRCLGESADRRGDKKAEPWYVTGTYGLPTAEDTVPTAAEAPAAAAAALEPAAARPSRRGRAMGDAADPLHQMQQLVDKKRKHTEDEERSSKRKRLDALRQERVAREQAERQRALELMRAKHPGLFEGRSGGRPDHGGSAAAADDDRRRGGRRRSGDGDDGTTRESAAMRQHRERMAQRRGRGQPQPQQQQQHPHHQQQRYRSGESGGHSSSDRADRRRR